MRCSESLAEDLVVESDKSVGEDVLENRDDLHCCRVRMIVDAVHVNVRPFAIVSMYYEEFVGVEGENCVDKLRDLGQEVSVAHLVISSRYIESVDGSSMVGHKCT